MGRAAVTRCLHQRFYDINSRTAATRVVDKLTDGHDRRPYQSQPVERSATGASSNSFAPTLTPLPLLHWWLCFNWSDVERAAISKIFNSIKPSRRWHFSNRRRYFWHSLAVRARFADIPSNIEAQGLKTRWAWSAAKHTQRHLSWKLPKSYCWITKAANKPGQARPRRDH